jgi:hypothetical protein
LRAICDGNRLGQQVLDLSVGKIGKRVH